MDKTLNLKLEQFKKTLKSLDISLKHKKNDLVRDSVIKRFEYSFEICLKTIKVFLNNKFGEDVFFSQRMFPHLTKK